MIGNRATAPIVAALAAVLSTLPAAAEEPLSVDCRARADWRLIGAEGGDELGVQALFADLDGDGFDDIVLGAWLADGERNERPRAGEVYVFFGHAMEHVSGIERAPSVIYGGRPGDRIGSDVDTGDFDGDGVSDLLIGARYANGPADSLRHRCGEAFLFLGGSDGASGKKYDLRDGADVTFIGAFTGDRLGRRITADDLDGDGRDDLLISAIGADSHGGDTPDAGAVHIIYGAPREDLEGYSDLFEIEPPVLRGADESDGLGGAVATGDCNGDGAPDIVLGCGFADGPANGRTNSGETYILLGRKGKRLEGTTRIAEGSEVTIYGAEAYDGAGVSVAAGDMDGDGIDDIAIGAYLADGPANGRDKCGEAYILFGNRSMHETETFDLAVARDVIIFGAEKGDQLGSVLDLADINGDAYADLVISALLNDGPGGRREDAGMVFIIFGGPQRSLRSRVDLSTGGGDLFLLGPSASDKISTLITTGHFGGKSLLFAGTMVGDGAGDRRIDSGEIYLLQREDLDRR